MNGKSNSSSRRPGQIETLKRKSVVHDVIIVGGGPAGSVMAWTLAGQGKDVLVLERARFPREKVCGDFVEPRGLRILDKMGCLSKLEETDPLPITDVAMFLETKCAYRGRIPFYGQHSELSNHGFIIPREILDHRMLQCAADAGATVHEEVTVKSVTTSKRGVSVTTSDKSGASIFHAQFIVGADGVNSVVAKSAGLLERDPRHIAVSQRVYVDGVVVTGGEAAFFFDQDLFPGYGWMFPMAGHRANVGVGILSESRDRNQTNVPQLLTEFIEKLRDAHPGCANIKVSGRTMGGIVKTYGGAGKNYFNRGLLIGDAGCFVDPMTGEGITPAMESALIGASIISAGIEQGKFDAVFLSSYEQAFRRYFDPSFCYIDLCATLMRNPYFGNFWLKSIARGCELALEDEEFARTTGATFGGMQVDPVNIASQVWRKVLGEVISATTQSLFGMASGDIRPISDTLSTTLGLQLNWWRSVASDPVWHARWAADVSKKWLKLLTILPRATDDPRVQGLLS